MNVSGVKELLYKKSLKDTAKKSGKWLIGRLFLYLFLVVLGFVFLYPFLFMLTRSIMSYNDIVDVTVKWFPKEFSPENYALAYKTLDATRTGLNSLILTAACTFGHVISCSFIGYGLGRWNYKFTKLLFAFVVLSIIIPAQNLIIPRYIIYSSFEKLLGISIIDTYIPMIVPTYLGFGLNGGIFVFLYRQYYLRYPKAIEEAAFIDGAGSVKTFFAIALPTASSTTLVVTILSIVWHWNDYYEPSIFLTSPTKWLIPQVLPDMYRRILSEAPNQQTSINEAVIYHAGVVMAGTVISIIPLIIVYFIMQKRFMEGVERSGLVE